MKAEEQKRFQEERCKRMDEQNQLLNEEQKKSDEDMEDNRGIEKLAWKLPDFIKRDGIMKFTCRNCGGGDRGRVAIYRPFGKFRRAKIALAPVWCSRPTTGVPLAHATMNFVGLDLTTSDRWSTTVELSNRHSSCEAVSSSIRVAGGGKRKDTARPRASQRFSMGLRSGEYASHAIRAIPSLSR
ncbi:uncharacterized protein TNCV_3475861 [Trichonephila clavipes]|nr:uncharacterized protein TNCV_3475861 [Trichonephila clavipes]